MKRSSLILKFMSVFFLIAALSACGKGCNKGGSPAGQIDPLTLIPANNNLLLSINWKKLIGTPFFQDASKDMPSEAKEISKDVNEAVIAVAMRGPSQAPSGLAIVSGNFDEPKIVGLIEEAAKKQGSGEVKKENIDGKTVHLSAKDPNIGMVFLSPHQAAWGQIATLRESLALLNNKGDSVKSNKELVDLFNKRDSNKLLWGAAILPPPPAGQTPAQAGDPMAALQGLKTFSLGIDYNNKDISIDWAGNTQEASQAQNIVNLVNSYKTIFGATLAAQQPSLGQVIQGAQISNQDKTIHISLKLNEEVLKQLSQKMADKNKESAPAPGAASPALPVPAPTGQAAAPANQ